MIHIKKYIRSLLKKDFDTFDYFDAIVLVSFLFGFILIALKIAA